MQSFLCFYYIVELKTKLLINIIWFSFSLFSFSPKFELLPVSFLYIFDSYIIIIFSIIKSIFLPVVSLLYKILVCIIQLNLIYRVKMHLRYLHFFNIIYILIFYFISVSQHFISLLILKVRVDFFMNISSFIILHSVLSVSILHLW